MTVEANSSPPSHQRRFARGRRLSVGMSCVVAIVGDPQSIAPVRSDRRRRASHLTLKLAQELLAALDVGEALDALLFAPIGDRGSQHAALKLGEPGDQLVRESQLTAGPVVARFAGVPILLLQFP